MNCGGLGCVRSQPLTESSARIAGKKRACAARYENKHVPIERAKTSPCASVALFDGNAFAQKLQRTADVQISTRYEDLYELPKIERIAVHSLERLICVVETTAGHFLKDGRNMSDKPLIESGQVNLRRKMKKRCFAIQEHVSQSVLR